MRSGYFNEVSGFFCVILFFDIMVKINGVQVNSTPSETLPLCRRYYLF